MKKTLFVLLALSLVAGGAMAQSKPQWDAKKGMFVVEKDAVLSLAMDSDAYGQAIVALWDKLHPEAVGAVEFLNMGSDGTAKKLTDLQGDAPDVLMALMDQAIPNAAAIANLDPNLVKVAVANVDAQFYTATNKMYPAGPKVIPFAYDGMAFGWNKTMLEKLGENVKSVNAKTNLPANFDTFEEIFALAKKWDANRPSYLGKKVNIVFPLSADEPWSGFSSVTAGGWGIFSSGDPLKPGFEDPKFLKGLEFIKAARDAKISVEADGSITPGASANWRWDPALNDQTAPFTLVGTWMDVKAATTKGAFDMQFATMPSWKGVTLKPFLKAKVFIANAFSKYPSASAELMRILFTKEGMQAMINTTSYVPALKAGSKIAPDYSKDNVKKQMAAAFLNSYVEPATLMLPVNTKQQANSVYYSIAINQFYKDVWDGKMTPAEAQKGIVSAAAKWITENNVAK